MKLVAFCEAASDFRVLEGLVDRVLREHGPGWVADVMDANPDGVRVWIRDGAGRAFFDLHQVRFYAQSLGLRPAYGYFGRRPGRAGAIMARKVLSIARCLMAEHPELEAVVLVWDMDKQPERGEGLEQARHEAAQIAPFAIVFGCANPMREAWVLAGFEPEDEDETRRLRDLTVELGFSPVHQAHQLTAADETAKRSPKRVLRYLSAGDHNREERCWVETPLASLRDRGAETGLREFLDEVKDRVLPRLLRP